MKPNELRIGNFIATDNENTPLRVESIEDRENNLYYVKAATIEGFVGRKGSFPVPVLKGIVLTEEWLIKFGFQNLETKDGVGFYLPDFMFFELWKKNADMGFFQFVRIVKGVVYLLSKKLKYVHELQNLYFSMTEHELKLN